MDGLHARTDGFTSLAVLVDDTLTGLTLPRPGGVPAPLVSAIIRIRR